MTQSTLPDGIRDRLREATNIASTALQLRWKKDDLFEDTHRHYREIERLYRLLLQIQGEEWPQGDFDINSFDDDALHALSKLVQLLAPDYPQGITIAGLHRAWEARGGGHPAADFERLVNRLCRGRQFTLLHGRVVYVPPAKSDA